MDRSLFSQRLKQLRSLQGISQYALADALGVSRTSLKNWELAAATPPLDVLVDMAMYFRVSSDYLLGLDERRSIQISFLSGRYVDALTNLVRVMEERACCRKAAKEGKKLLKEKSSTEKAWDILMRYGSCVFKLLIDCQLRVSVDA